MPKLVIISNGHGEDHIGAQLAKAVQEGFPNWEILPFPLVGKGQAYARHQLTPLIQNPSFPSGGFIRGLGVLIQDLKAGLLTHIWRQKKQLKTLISQADHVLCVGDIFALWMGSTPQTKAKTTFLPTAKSDKFLPHSSIEKGLMRRSCAHIFTRDALTAENLQTDGLPAQFLGNPMMDGLNPVGEHFPFSTPDPVIGILPGSRDEALANLDLIFQILDTYPTPLNLVIAKSPSLTLGPHQSRHAVHITENFADVIAQADLIIGLAGTANEQAVYWKKTVISFPGTGPQTTPQRLQEQAQLLDHRINFLNTQDPTRITGQIAALLTGKSKTPAPPMSHPPAARLIIQELLRKYKNPKTCDVREMSKGPISRLTWFGSSK